MSGFSVYKTKIGFIKIAYEGQAVTLLERCKEGMIEDFGQKTELTELVHGQLLEYFEGKRRQFSFGYTLHGTEFQKKVWQALCDIPYGEIRSYKDIAVAVGNPKACRAVGMANNKNPISIAVPCHRVIGAGGKLVGYGGGLDMKEFLLRLEGALD